jgi:NitT/TauT family transport system permease protein
MTDAADTLPPTLTARTVRGGGVPATVRLRRLLAGKAGDIILPWAVVIALFSLWELAVFAFRIPDFILPSPSDIYISFTKWWRPIIDNAAFTLFATAAGFAIAIVVGLAGGVAIGSSAIVYRAFYPVLIGFNSIPKIVVAPILIIWFGIGLVPAVITAFLISFFPIVVNVATGIATVEQEFVDILKALGARKRDVIWKVGLPRSMPYFFASLKVGITTAFVGSIVSEFVGANKGIGHLITVASSRFDTPLVFAGALTTAFMGIAMYWIAAFFERRATGWATRSSQSAQQPTT